MNIIRCPQQALSADFGDIIIGDVAEKMDFKVAFGTEVILMESYFPDSDGKIYIRDIALLAEIYRQKISLTMEEGSAAGAITFHLQFTENTQTLIASATLYACETETAGTLTVDNLLTIPLSRCFRKSVCPTQKEYISFYGTGNITLELVYTAISQDSVTAFNFINLPANQNTLYRLDVSPETVAAFAGIEPERIIYYVLYKDKKMAIKFTMNPYLQPQATFIFQNTFGAWETFTCTGDLETERKWTREYGQSNRRQLLISREMEATDTVHTGYLTREQTGVLEDLLNANWIARIDEYGWHPVTISEETFKVVSRKDELIDAEFKYRLSGNNRMQYRFKPFKYRIFDFTFNNTFN